MLPVPEKIDRYVIRDTLGKGAMGVVYLALDPTIDREVAIKAIRDSEFRASPDGDEMEARFRREIHTAGLLTHSNIVTIYDGGKDGSIHWIAMEYIDGPSLGSLMKESNRIPVQATLDILIKVCDAIEFAHKKNIIHRDLKPGNILLTADGEPKIADFGIARIESSTMTQTGVILGTPSYMSPEQVKGQEIDTRSDLFSLGVILYEMLTGRRPFKGDSPTSIMYQIVHEETRPPHVHNAEVPVPLSRVVMKALAKRPSDRYSTGARMSADLRAIRESGGLETTIRDLDASLDEAEIRAVPDMDTLSRLEALEENDKDGLPGPAKFLIVLLVLVAITAGAYYAYLFLNNELDNGQEEPDVPALEARVITKAVSISTNVAEAEVFIDGERVGQADGETFTVNGEAGEPREFVIKADCYQPLRDTILLQEDGPLNREYTLERLSKTVRITTKPEGAKLFLDGEELGEAPLEYALKCDGEITLKAKQEGFHSASSTVIWQELEEGEEITLELSEIAAGSLTISAPYPVTARLDNGTSLSLSDGTVNLPPGKYNIRLTNERFFLNTRRTVTVTEGGAATINDLPPLGEIWIREIPVHDGVAIIKGFENNVMQLPVLERPIAAGSHTVVIRWDDGEEMVRQVEVRPDKPATLNVRKGAK